MATNQKQTIDSQLSSRLFYQREYNISHLPYKTELTFYEAVREGDTETLEKIMLPLDSDQLGKLSDNPVRSMQYHLIITIAFITRFCMEGGMNEEEAYTLSDLNVQKTDRCNDAKALVALHKQIVFDYANRMKKYSKREYRSLTILKCTDYIHNNLHKKIVLNDIAEYCGKNPTYICDLFKKEMGITISHYIRNQRVEAACNMLKYSEYTPVDIANYLGFCSHSRFISVFKERTGLTPREYRNAYFSTNWSDYKTGAD